MYIGYKCQIVLWQKLIKEDMKEAIMLYFSVLSMHLLGSIEEETLWNMVDKTKL
jgi:hypothetical protein